MTAFVRRFGSPNSKGKYTIASYLTSIMNSFPYLGKLVVSILLLLTIYMRLMLIVFAGLLDCHTPRRTRWTQKVCPSHHLHIVHVRRLPPALHFVIECSCLTPHTHTHSGVLLQITATTIAQFTIGRCLCYAMTGICVNVMPAFMAECAPASLRGMVTSQLQMQIVVAQLVASAVNYGTSTIKTNAGWRISVGMQLQGFRVYLVDY
jgi:SP family sugar:H+ symporter-like MFS transporter